MHTTSSPLNSHPLARTKGASFPSEYRKFLLLSVFRSRLLTFVTVCAAFLSQPAASALSHETVVARLGDFDSFAEQLLVDWNAPGVGVAVVTPEGVVFSKGYGFRDYETKAPLTTQTLFQIASNTKLFTVIAAGMLVEEGLLTWDEPIRDKVPELRFATPELDASVTLRDMLAHRAGVPRHDFIWYQSEYTREELFERIRYMEPTTPIRTRLIYNNMMYVAVGHIIELKTGLTWEEFLRERLFGPLSMERTLFEMDKMQADPDYGVPYAEKRDSFELYRIPHYADTNGAGPAGSIISNLEDMAKWVSALLNNGEAEDLPVIPPTILRETLVPALALPDANGERHGWWERLSDTAGMGRFMMVYRGHRLTNHGGAIDGFFSQVAILLDQRVGIITFSIGEHTSPVPDILAYNIVDRVLGIEQTPWNERHLTIRLRAKQAGTEARARGEGAPLAGVPHAHPLTAYTGEFEHPAFGSFIVSESEGSLLFSFRNLALPLNHVQFERFDTINDERFGVFSLRYLTGSIGDITEVIVDLNEHKEFTFSRKIPPPDAATLELLKGNYLDINGGRFEIIERQGKLAIRQPSNFIIPLVHLGGTKYRFENSETTILEFILEDGHVTKFLYAIPGSVFEMMRMNDP
jgi:CubicO group peptidase (beta-lactamase class C family)